jgi:hypothetical protein
MCFSANKWERSSNCRERGREHLCEPEAETQRSAEMGIELREREREARDEHDFVYIGFLLLCEGNDMLRQKYIGRLDQLLSRLVVMTLFNQLKN